MAISKETINGTLLHNSHPNRYSQPDGGRNETGFRGDKVTRENRDPYRKMEVEPAEEAYIGIVNVYELVRKDEDTNPENYKEVPLQKVRLTNKGKDKKKGATQNTTGTTNTTGTGGLGAAFDEFDNKTNKTNKGSRKKRNPETTPTTPSVKGTGANMVLAGKFEDIVKNKNDIPEDAYRNGKGLLAYFAGIPMIPISIRVDHDYGPMFKANESTYKITGARAADILSEYANKRDSVSVTHQTKSRIFYMINETDGKIDYYENDARLQSILERYYTKLKAELLAQKKAEEEKKRKLEQQQQNTQRKSRNTKRVTKKVVTRKRDVKPIDILTNIIDIKPRSTSTKKQGGIKIGELPGINLGKNGIFNLKIPRLKL